MRLFSQLRLSLLRTLCLTLLLAAASSPTLAKPVSFYSASIPVSAQSTSERDRAAAAGLREVLIRVSGVTRLEDYPGVPEVLARASRYMEQFHYEVVRDAGNAQEHLVMAFSPSAVDGALKQAGLPFWPVNRPSVLVWLVEDDVTEGKRLINDTNAPLAQGLLQAARQRGLTLNFPLLDLDDQLAISADQVWNLDEAAILDASARYGGDTVLIGRVASSFAGDWWTTWQFFHKGEGRLYELRDIDAAAIGQQALTPLADHLAQLYTLKSNIEGAGQLYIQVGPVNDFGTYRKTLDYLSRLAVVTSFNLLAVTDETLLLSLQLKGSQDQLLSALALDRKLRPRTGQMGAPRPMAGGDQPLQLEWIGR